MYGQEKKKNPRNTALALDVLHIVVGILIVLLAVLAFLDPDGNIFLFPAIFWLAAFLNGVNGWSRIRAGGRDRKKKTGGAVQCGAAALLFIIGVLSAVSIGR